MSIREIEWDHGPIGPCVDDAAKSPAVFDHLVRQFGPSCVPGKTTLAFLDFKHWKKARSPKVEKAFQIQMEFVEEYADCFELLMDSKRSAASVFLYAARSTSRP